LPVFDLSMTGFAARAPDGLALAPGSALGSFELLLDGRPIWTGEAVVVHENTERIGARFVSGVVDLRHVRVGATIDGRLSLFEAQRTHLPAEWRAAVGDLSLLLESARLEVDEFERVVPHDPIHRREEEAVLFERLRSRWGTAYYEAVAALHARSKCLDERAAQLGRGYASSVLMPILSACPMHRRAYEKPLGYAGDYRMMELYFARDLTGDTLFGRFLHSVSQGYSLGRAVVARETLMREAARAAVEASGEGPVRILSVASGPALELQRLLRETTSLRRPLHLLLLDQDEAALEIAHRRLQRGLVDASREHPVTVTCLHFSVRQILQPRTPDEMSVVSETLADLDLVYSAGLYDYLPAPVAQRLTQVLYSRVRPGGRLLVGNLTETPDTTWIMEYVLGWDLLYRTPELMLQLAEGLTPSPARVGIARDSTGRSLFLDVVSAA
jgi:extracellular factor (EF) 3-hydroxypalmitic acid methyl ester biosynthesis protein